MERLSNILDVGGKKMIQCIWKSGIVYPTLSKCLKRDYGNPTIALYLKLKALFKQPQL